MRRNIDILLQMFLSLLDSLFSYQCAVFLTVLLCIVIKAALWRYRLPCVKDINNKYVLITGCDSGFGEKLCYRLDSLGCHVFACCLTTKGIETLKNRCSRNVLPLLLDIKDKTNIQKVADQVKELLNGKKLWGLVNNAGVCGALGPIEWLQRKDFREILEINLLGNIDMTISILPLMKSNLDKGARIVNMTSILGTFHTPYSAPYCVSKSALDVFSYILGIELKKMGIKVIVIEPGAHETNFISSISTSLLGSWERLPSEDKKNYGEEYYKKISYLGTTFTNIFSAKNLNSVIDAYCDALFKKHPKSRYVIGFDAALFNLGSYLPRPVLRFLYSFPGLLAKPKT